MLDLLTTVCVCFALGLSIQLCKSLATVLYIYLTMKN